LARCHLLLEQNEDAVEHAQNAKRIAIDEPEAMMLYARALIRLNRYEEARIDLIPLAENDQINTSMRLDACKMLFGNGERKVVGQALESIAAAGQANNDALIMLAKVYIEQNQLDKADVVCAALLKQPDAQSIRFATNYYRQTQRPELAEQALTSAQLSGVSEADRLMIRAEDAAVLGQTDEALSLILKAAENEPKSTMRWYNAIQLALSLSEPSDAIHFAKLATSHLPNDIGIASILKHEKLVMQTRDDLALIPLAVTILNDRTYRSTAIDTLRISSKNTDPATTANQLADLVKKQPGFKHLTELTLDRLLRAGQDERAYNMAGPAMARFTDSAASARVATLASFRMGDWTMLLNAANAWAQRNPNDRPKADLMRAAAMNELQRYDAAIRTLRPYMVLQKNFDNKSQILFDIYTRSLVRNGNTSLAWDTLSPHVATNAQARSIALRRVTEDISEAKNVADWIDWLSSDRDDATRLFETASAAFRAGQRLGDKALVQKAQREIASILIMPGPHGIDVLYAQGQIAQSLQDLDQAEVCYRKVLETAPENPLVLNNLAMVLLERGGNSLAEAEELAVKATQLSKTDPNLLDTLATIYLRRNKLDPAMQAIERAIKLDAKSPTWQLTKAAILEAKGDTESADFIREKYQ
ncbi:MAG: tetratricopeptide repeat protein, partial [Phycisphaeraceae bacterium]